MTPSLQRKLASLVVLSEELLQGGVAELGMHDYLGEAQARVEHALRDPELVQWMEDMRVRNPSLRLLPRLS